MAKPLRSSQVVNQLYINKAAELGDQEFRLEILIPEKIETLKREMRTLSKEADEIQAYELKKQQDQAIKVRDRVTKDAPVSP